MRNGVGTGDDRRGANRGTDIGRDLGQQRIGDPHHGLAGKARESKEDNGAGGRGDGLWGGH
jgi:hypothetical protein